MNKKKEAIENPSELKHREEIEAGAELLKALANPVRLCLLEKLIEDGPTNVSEIGACMEVSQPNLSQHLRVLRSHGIVAGEKRENRVYYSCVREDVKKIMETLNEVIR